MPPEYSYRTEATKLCVQHFCSLFPAHFLIKKFDCRGTRAFLYMRRNSSSHRSHGPNGPGCRHCREVCLSRRLLPEWTQIVQVPHPARRTWPTVTDSDGPGTVLDLTSHDLTSHDLGSQSGSSHGETYALWPRVEKLVARASLRDRKQGTTKVSSSWPISETGQTSRGCHCIYIGPTGLRVNIWPSSVGSRNATWSQVEDTMFILLYRVGPLRFWKGEFHF